MRREDGNGWWDQLDIDGNVLKSYWRYGRTPPPVDQQVIDRRVDEIAAAIDRQSRIRRGMTPPA